MIPRKHDEQCASRRRHQHNARVSKHIRPDSTSSVVYSDFVLHLLTRPIQNTEIQITTGVVLRRVLVISIENTVDNQVCHCEEETRYSARVRDKLISLEKSVKEKTSIWEWGTRNRRQARHWASVWRPCHTKCWIERRVMWPIRSTISVLDAFATGMGGGQVRRGRKRDLNASS